MAVCGRPIPSLRARYAIADAETEAAGESLQQGHRRRGGRGDGQLRLGRRCGRKQAAGESGVGDVAVQEQQVGPEGAHGCQRRPPGFE